MMVGQPPMQRIVQFLRRGFDPATGQSRQFARIAHASIIASIMRRPLAPGR
jgi:hypothetical protein